MDKDAVSRALRHRPSADDLRARGILKGETAVKAVATAANTHRAFPPLRYLTPHPLMFAEEGASGLLVHHQLQLLQDKLAHRPALADLRRSAVLRDTMLWTRLDLP